MTVQDTKLFVVVFCLLFVSFVFATYFFPRILLLVLSMGAYLQPFR